VRTLNMPRQTGATTPDSYADREDAGRALAELLSRYAAQPGVVVLGLPRGGVPVAARVATALGAPLDVLVVRKLGLPWQPELAMGAIAGVGEEVQLIRNDPVLTRSHVSPRVFDAVYRRELLELRRREDSYRAGRPPAQIHDRTVILVDDGLATGSTMRAGVAAVRTQRPSRVVVAVPVGAAETCAALRNDVDEVVCALTPDRFTAVGQAYHNFTPTSDDEVRHLLAAAPTG
jgi:putative phosphoribosyl transferase